MFTARSILSLRATSTATQCSAALPTIATTIAPMKNSLSPTDSAASWIEPTRISLITPTATPAIASIATDRRTVHGSCPSLRLVLGVEEVAVRLHREDEAGGVDRDHQHRDPQRQVLDLRGEVADLVVRAAAARRGRRA